MRSKYPNDNFSVLYDDTLMPADLRKAHKENDRAVLQAYGFPQDATESEILARLFEMYENLAQNR
ncbi:type IIL restriction-modification enzyme MmeI [uncultured Treponema sp.]|uniref:type IIL restriction-modification enzyme MmeI n=1 Tax=uncultured Treponema sp. TaxID=162155 RepID=UPI003450BD26